MENFRKSLLMLFWQPTGLARLPGLRMGAVLIAVQIRIWRHIPAKSRIFVWIRLVAKAATILLFSPVIHA
jgi:hypothetical protein